MVTFASISRLRLPVVRIVAVPTGQRDRMGWEIMRRGFWVSVVFLLLVLVGPASAAAGQVPEDPTLIVDLSAGEAFVEEHTAQLLWNLMTDNFDLKTYPNVEGWNSLYLEEPQTISGQVVVDLEAGTVKGEIVERWVCDGDCRTSTDTPSWTTTRKTGWTATITDGRLESDGDGWTVSGSVAISYDSTVTANETPSDCGGTPCYLCLDRVCKVGGTASATAALTGWVDGRTVSLAFADRMEVDVYQMDLSALERTEFFMSRFSITITPPLDTGSAGGPVGQDNPVTTATSSVESGITDVPAGRIIPGVDAGAPFDIGASDAGSTTSTTAAKAAETSDDESDRPSIGSIILIIALVLGVGAALVLVRRLFGKKKLLEQAGVSRAERRSARAAQASAQSASEWFRKEATHTIEPGHVIYVPNPRLVAEAKAKGKEIPQGWDAPLPLSLELAPGDPKHPEEEGPIIPAVVRDGLTVVVDPDNPDFAVLRTGAHVMIHEGQLTPLPSDQFAPAHQLTGDKYIQGSRVVDGKKVVVAHQPGTPVQVITTVGNQSLVRVDAKTELWVPRSNIVATSAMSQTDDLGAVSGSGPSAG